MIIDNNYFENSSEEKSELILKTIDSENNKCLFLDRDGVIIYDVNHIDSVLKVKLCENIVSFLSFARNNNFDIAIVTNQSSVSRKIITHKKYNEITEALLSKLPIELYPRFILASFHLPKNLNKLPYFNWRKPGTGMFDQILIKGNYNKNESIMIGDKITDLLPAYKCKIKNLFFLPSKLHYEDIFKVKLWNKQNSNDIKIIRSLDTKYLES